MYYCICVIMLNIYISSLKIEHSNTVCFVVHDSQTWQRIRIENSRNTVWCTFSYITFEVYVERDSNRNKKNVDNGVKVR